MSKHRPNRATSLLTAFLCACAWTPREGCVVGVGGGFDGTSDVAIGIAPDTFDTGGFDSRATDTGTGGTCAARLTDSSPEAGEQAADPYAPVALMLSEAVAEGQISVSAAVPGTLVGDGTLWTWTPDVPLRGDRDWLLVVTVCGVEEALPFHTRTSPEVAGWLDGRTYRLNPNDAPPSALLAGMLPTPLISWADGPDGLVATVGQEGEDGQQDLCAPAGAWEGSHALPWLSAAGSSYVKDAGGVYYALEAEFGLTSLEEGGALVGALTLGGPRSAFAAVGVDPDLLCADLSGLSGCATINGEERVLLYVGGLTAEPVEVSVVETAGCGG